MFKVCGMSNKVKPDGETNLLKPVLCALMFPGRKNIVWS